MAETKQLTGAGATLRVNVVTPRGPITDEKTDAVTAPGELGEFEVLPGHIPFLTELHPGVLTLGEKVAKSHFAVGRGYLRVGPDGGIEVLVERAVPADDVDVSEAKDELAAAVKEADKWKGKEPDAELQGVLQRRDWAQARLDAKARIS